MSEIKLHHGDCLEIMKDMPDKSVDTVFADPPYDFTLGQIERVQTEFERIASEWIIVFCPPENRWYPMADLPIQRLFWVKPISTKNTSRRYSRFVECVVVVGSGTWNANRHWSQYTNVFTDLVDNKLHPHAKPVSLLTRLILNHTNPESTILDPYMGSGTTGVACVQTGRNFIGHEIDGGYYNIAKKRIEEAQLQRKGD